VVVCALLLVCWWANDTTTTPGADVDVDYGFGSQIIYEI
jgi:hypothetical protein